MCRMIALLMFNMSLTEATTRKPNIILFPIDDMGYGDIAAHGNPLLKTPNFDRLHAESVRFTDFLASPEASTAPAALGQAPISRTEA
jgi:arylsulfatase A-like enzyme